MARVSRNDTYTFVVLSELDGRIPTIGKIVDEAYEEVDEVLIASLRQDIVKGLVDEDRILWSTHSDHSGDTSARCLGFVRD